MHLECIQGFLEQWRGITSIGCVCCKQRGGQRRSAQSATSNREHHAEAKHQGIHHHSSSNTTQQLEQQAATVTQENTSSATFITEQRRREQRRQQQRQTQHKKQQQQPPSPTEPKAYHHPKAQHAPGTCRLQHNRPRVQARDSDTNHWGARRGCVCLCVWNGGRNMRGARAAGAHQRAAISAPSQVNDENVPQPALCCVAQL
jgi:hypothetical protein